MRKSLAFACAFALFSTRAALAADPDMAGTFSDGKITVEMKHAADGYTGTLSQGGQTFPAAAKFANGGLEGAFRANGKDYDFTLDNDAGEIFLNIGATEYKLRPVGPAPAPGRDAGADNPFGRQPPSPTPPADTPPSPANDNPFTRPNAGGDPPRTPPGPPSAPTPSANDNPFARPGSTPPGNDNPFARPGTSAPPPAAPAAGDNDNPFAKPGNNTPSPPPAQTPSNDNPFARPGNGGNNAAPPPSTPSTSPPTDDNPFTKPRASAGYTPTFAAAGSTAPPGEMPAEYKLIRQIDVGKAFGAQKPQKTVADAMSATIADLSHLFGERPRVVGAYEDTRDHRSGVASFESKVAGEPVRGMASVQLNESGALVAVVYCKADAKPEQWKKLFEPEQQAGGQGQNPAGAAQQVNLTRYEFPDGSGSVGLADGWKTDAKTLTNTVYLQGPAGQTVVLGQTYIVNTPNSQAVRMRRQFGGNYPMIVGPFCEPVDALSVIFPQVSKMSQANGGAAIELGQIYGQQPAQPMLPNGKAVIASYAIRKTEKGQVVNQRVMAKLEVSAVGNESWMLFASAIIAPEESFAADQPAMLAMFNSYRENGEVVKGIYAQRQQNQNDQFAAGQAAHRDQVARFEAGQAAHRDQMAGYDAYNKSQADQSLVRSRSNTDFVETIRGTRTILDTQTGEKTSADLGNVTGIVNGLNDRDPGRYQEIPLRDELYPK